MEVFSTHFHGDQRKHSVIPDIAWILLIPRLGRAFSSTTKLNQETCRAGEIELFACGAQIKRNPRQRQGFRKLLRECCLVSTPRVFSPHHWIICTNDKSATSCAQSSERHILSISHTTRLAVAPLTAGDDATMAPPTPDQHFYG